MLAGDRNADVLGDRHVGQEGGMLMHDRDSEILRACWGEIV
jgi:hypothetical protein